MDVALTFSTGIKLLPLSGSLGNAMEDIVETFVTKTLAVSAQRTMEQAVTQTATRRKSTASDATYFLVLLNRIAALTSIDTMHWHQDAVCDCDQHSIRQSSGLEHCPSVP